MTDILYFQCLSGISGDMFTSALLDLGLDFKYIKSELKKLPVSNYKISIQNKSVNGIKCAQLVLDIKKHTSHHTTYSSIIKLIKSSKLKKKHINEVIDIMTLIGEAESKIHNIPLKNITFHEIGAVDSIIDITAAVLCRNILEKSKIIVSDITLGNGTSKTQHGIIPIPAPATLELLRGIPVKKIDINSELVTPTGAVLIKYYAEEFVNTIPEIVIEKTGYGAGAKIIKGLPNLLRVIKGTVNYLESDNVIVIETNIDDISPELMGYIFRKLWELKVKEVYTQPVNMKKDRVGLKLTVICDRLEFNHVINTLLGQGITLGIRYTEMERVKLKRKIVKLDTEFGKVNFKIAYLPDGSKIMKPEYNDIEKISNKLKKPVLEIQRSLLRLNCPQ